MTVDAEMWFVKTALDYAVETSKLRSIKADVQSDEALVLALSVLRKVYRDIMPTVTVKEG
jgi:hypothetical protein